MEHTRHNGHINPLAGLVVDLQPARLVLGFEDREAAVIAMGARAELARLGRDGGRGVIAHAEATDVLVNLVVKEPFGLVECERKQAHQRAGQVRQDAKIGGIDLL